jgi:hypothetical protein
MPMLAGWPIYYACVGCPRGTSTPKPREPCRMSGANALTWCASRPRPCFVYTRSSCGRRVCASVPTRQMPGADVGRTSETFRGLEPAGWMGRRPHCRHHTQENRYASAATRRGWSVLSGTQRKKLSKGVEGGVFTLDRNLLMGGFPILSAIPSPLTGEGEGESESETQGTDRCP